MELQTTALMRARHMLETQGRFPGGALPQDISESWLRSLSLGLDPLARPRRMMLDAAGFRESQTRHAELIRLARPELEQLFDQIAGSYFSIALGSPEGVVLETLADASFASSEAGRIIVPGSIWTEDLRGTNALGLSLWTGRPAQVYGGEHFLRAHSDIACISAPIFDGHGGLAGVLDASSQTTARQQHTAALVQMSASNIENSLIRAANHHRVVLQFHPRPEYLGTLSVGMLVLEEDATVHAVNRRGEMLLAGLPQLHGAAFAAIFEQRFEDVAMRLVQGETLRLRDRMGSALSVRCVANRASFTLAARTAVVADRDSALPDALVVATPGAVPRLPRNVVVEDRRLLDCAHQMVAAARLPAPVLVRGEAGVGKKTIARLAHAAAGRKGPFVAVDARIFAGSGADAAFFGLAGGAPGLLAQAAEGTLFIDGLSHLPLSVQTVLAQVLERGEYHHPADGALHRCRPFLVATLHEDPEAAAASGRLLPALRFRLGGAVVTIPALRERGDLAPLARRIARDLRSGVMLDAGAVARLQRHAWPGNLHELRALLARAVLRLEGDTLGASDIGALLGEALGATAGAVCPHCAGVPWKEESCRAIREAVARCGSVAGAARELGMSRTTVYRHLEGG